MTGRRGFLAMLVGLMPGARLMRAMPAPAPFVPSPLVIHAAAMHYKAAAMLALVAECIEVGAFTRKAAT